MTPFGTFPYFGVLLVYIAIPTLLLALIPNKKIFNIWIFLSTLIMLCIQYTHISTTHFTLEMQDLLYVFGYFIYECLIGYFYLSLSKATKNKIIFVLFMFLALLPLLIVKTSQGDNSPYGFVGFIGISYITFRALDVLIGVRNGTITNVPFFQYFVYLLFFPTISSGPIDRYKRFSQDWNHKRTKSELLSDVDTCVQKIFQGFLYKFIIGELIVDYFLSHLSVGNSFLKVFGYMYAYSLYLFFDFAGYSNFAIGVSYLFGIHTPENFNLPFLSQNIKEFWNRWHISLSSWFRDNIYTPFVYSSLKNNWLKSKYLASYIGYFLTMTLMGFWHGFTSFYIIYGIYHATLLITYDIFNRWHKKHPLFIDKHILFTKWLSIFITFNFVCFGLLIFSGRLNGQNTVYSTPSKSSNAVVESIKSIGKPKPKTVKPKVKTLKSSTLKSSTAPIQSSTSPITAK